MFFCTSLSFSMIQRMSAIWFLALLPFLNPACTSIWKFLVHVLLKPSLKDFGHNFTSMKNESNYTVVWTFFDTALFGFGIKTDIFLSRGHCWVFQICWHIECSTLTASSFRIWNSSTGIPSPPLALFVIMLSKAHLTSHSRMSGSSWVITPSWLSWSVRPLLYSSSFYSCHLFLISSAFVRSLSFLSFIVPIHAWNIPLFSPIFLKSSLVSHSIVLLYFFALSIAEGLLILAILWNSALNWIYLSLSPLLFATLLSSATCKGSSDNFATLPSWISFSWRWFWSLSPVQCYKPWSIVLQSLCLPYVIP